MADSTLLARTGRGVLVGVAGTATMTAWQKLSAKLQSRGGSGGQESEADPWASAPAPAKVGRLLLHAVGYEVPATRVGLLTNVMHWGYGTGWGAVYGAVMGEAPHRWPLLSGLAFGGWVWVMSYVQLVPVGIYELPWKYPLPELGLDLSYHLAYGAGVGAADALLPGLAGG